MFSIGIGSVTLFPIFSTSMENVTVYAQSKGVQVTAKLVIKDFPKVMSAYCLLQIDVLQGDVCMQARERLCL